MVFNILLSKIFCLITPNQTGEIKIQSFQFSEEKFIRLTKIWVENCICCSVFRNSTFYSTGMYSTNCLLAYAHWQFYTNTVVLFSVCGKCCVCMICIRIVTRSYIKFLFFNLCKVHPKSPMWEFKTFRLLHFWQIYDCHTFVG